MTVACIVGPYLTGHQFTTIYPDYVRVPPSLSAYPQGDEIEAALADALRRGRVDLRRLARGGRPRLRRRHARRAPIDERITRYLDRSSTFEDARVGEKSRRRAVA